MRDYCLLGTWKETVEGVVKIHWTESCHHLVLYPKVAPIRWCEPTVNALIIFGNVIDEQLGIRNGAEGG